MKARKAVLPSLIGVILLGGVASAVIGANENSEKYLPKTSNIQTTSKEQKKKCDGKSVTSNCFVGKKHYKKYVYHPAVDAITHVETIKTDHEVVTGYCTLCNDGSFSPTCATGRGACSYHGGVANWNEPMTTNEPTYTNKTVIDTPKVKAYYEKVKD